MTATLELTVDVDAPVEQTWAGATDWAGQGQWMLGTQVRPTAQQVRVSAPASKPSPDWARSASATP